MHVFFSEIERLAQKWKGNRNCSVRDSIPNRVIMMREETSNVVCLVNTVELAVHALTN